MMEPNVIEKPFSVIEMRLAKARRQGVEWPVLLALSEEDSPGRALFDELAAEGLVSGGFGGLRRTALVSAQRAVGLLCVHCGGAGIEAAKALLEKKATRPAWIIMIDSVSVFLHALDRGEIVEPSSFRFPVKTRAVGERNTLGKIIGFPPGVN